MIEKYKKKGFDLDGAIVAAHQRGTTTGERWTEEEDDALAAAVVSHNWALIAAFVAVALLYSAAGDGITGAYVYAKRGEWESYEDELLKKAFNQSAAVGLEKDGILPPCLTVLRCSAGIDGITISPTQTRNANGSHTKTSC